jgi:hypothetical protein
MMGTEMFPEASVSSCNQLTQSVNWLQEETDVSGTISDPIITVMMMGTEMVPETSVSSCNQLARLCGLEDFIELCLCSGLSGKPYRHLL